MAGVSRERIVFANQLRGVAALCVVTVHYTVVYQLMRPMVGWVVAAPPYEGPQSPVATWLFPPWFDAGAFGVAVFFLISGFVIPFSLAGTTRLRFLGARALRIYPTFWAGLLVQWGAVFASAAYWGRPIVFGWQTFLLNALLVNTLVGSGSVDFVSWTLCIEVKFYLLAAVLRPAIVAYRVWPLLLIAALAVAFTVSAAGVLPAQLVEEAMYLVFMFAGTLFHYHYRGAVPAWRLAGGCLLLAGAAGLCWAVGPDAALWPRKPANYGYALALFGLAYAARGRFGRSALLGGLAAISYPLYLVHALLGFTVMSFLTMAVGVAYPAAALLAFTLVTLVAVALHRTIERVSVRAGHVLTRGAAPGRYADLRPTVRLDEFPLTNK